MGAGNPSEVYTLAEIAADGVLKDLAGRKGFDLVMDVLDDETLREIRDELAGTIYRTVFP